jgi:hypothetical protein
MNMRKGPGIENRQRMGSGMLGNLEIRINRITKSRRYLDALTVEPSGEYAGTLWLQKSLPSQLAGMTNPYVAYPVRGNSRPSDLPI